LTACPPPLTVVVTVMQQIAAHVLVQVMHAMRA